MRGRRKRVVQVVYAMLAALMALSLFTVVGPFSGSLSDLFGGGGSSSASSALDDQATNIEVKLKKSPNDPNLLASLVRTRYSAGNANVSVDPTTQQQQLTQAAIDEYVKSAAAWERYVKAVGKKGPAASVAALAATAEFYATTQATTLPEFNDSIGQAIKAQQVAVAARPTLNGYITLNRYAEFAGDTATANKAAAGARSKATASNKKAVEQTLTSFAKEGKQIQKQVKAFAKQQGKQGKQQIQNPFGGLAGGGSGASGLGSTGGLSGSP